MYSNGSLTIKKRRDGTYSNSTKTVEIDLKNGTAYSYREKIAYINHDKKYIIFNDHKYSPTTSNHQSHVRYFLNGHEELKNYKRYTIDISSLNYFNGTLESLSGGLRYSPGLEIFVKNEFKKYSEFLKDIKEKTEKRDAESKEREARRAKMKRLMNSIENLKYKSVKNFEKAISTQKELCNATNIQIGFSSDIPDDTLKIFSKYLMENKDLIHYLVRDRVIDRIKRLMAIETFSNLGDE